MREAIQREEQIMPTCLHGWGSDGINPSACPQCAVLGRQQDKEELVRLRAETKRTDNIFVVAVLSESGRSRRYSKAPCAKCGAHRVTASLEDESDGCGTYYDIKCEACGDAYRTDGPDS